MSRKHKSITREVLPDPFFNEIVVAKFINVLSRDGKKSKVQTIINKAFEYIEKKTGEDGLKTFKKALGNVKPSVEVKSRRIGGATYQVPVEVRPARRQSLGLRWLRDYARSRNGKTMFEKLAEELIDAASNRGGAVKKKEDVYKMAEANKAFAHLRW